MKNFRKNKFYKIGLMFISLIAGISLLVYPEKTSYLVIRIIGVAWILESIGLFIDLRIKYLKHEQDNN